MICGCVRLAVCVFEDACVSGEKLIMFRQFKYQYLDKAVERFQLALNLIHTVASSSRKRVSVKQAGSLYIIAIEGKEVFAPWIGR